jgi:hypothetical protein
MKIKDEFGSVNVRKEVTIDQDETNLITDYKNEDSSILLGE